MSVPAPASPDAPRLDGPALIHATRWLVYDTFRQAIATRLFWAMLAVSLLCTVFCLGVRVESALAPRQSGDAELYGKDEKVFTGADPAHAGKFSLLFGLVEVGHVRDAADGVRFLQVVLAGFVAGVIGFVLMLVWTAGFVPDFLQPAAAAVLLTKPVPRWVLLVGKYVGVLAFVGFEVGVFFLGTWLALSLATGVWEYPYLAAVPLFLIQFAVIYSFAVLLAVVTRSAMASVFGTVLFWLACWGMNVGRHYVVGFEELAGGAAELGPATRWLTEAGYWLLPKPADVMILLEQALGAARSTAALYDQPWFRAVQQQNAFHPELSVLASLLFSVVMLALASRQLADAEY